MISVVAVADAVVVVAADGEVGSIAEEAGTVEKTCGFGLADGGFCGRDGGSEGGRFWGSDGSWLL